MALCSDVHAEATEEIVGDPTEVALVVAARGAGFEKRALEKVFPRVAEVPFDSERESLFTQGLFSNRALLGAVFLTFLLQLATIYVPTLNGIFKTAPLNLAELMLTFGTASVMFWAVEGEKWLKRRRRSERADGRE
jgi:magnesium-transporting ATPase (P-type)